MHVVEMSREEQEQSVEKAREVAAEFRRLGPAADEQNTFCYESAGIMKESGLVGLAVPKEFGGMGADIWTVSRVATELSRGDGGIALSYNMHYIMVGIMLGLLTDEQKKEWLPRIADGDILCGTFSEARGFGGLADTRAVPQPEGGWRLYGKKTWGTLSEVSEIWSGSATITDADGNLPEDFETRVANEHNFIADFNCGNVEGVRIEKTWNALGMKATGTHTIHFDGYYIPESGDCGEMRGGILAKKHLGPTFAASVGADVETKDLGYIRDGIGWMKVKNETARRVLHSTCQQLLDGDDENWDPMLRVPLIGIAKVFCTENCLDVARKAMHLVGGMSYRKGHPLERLYRDAAAGPFQPLTEEQTYMVIGDVELAGD